MKTLLITVALVFGLNATSTAQADPFASPWTGIDEAQVRLIAADVPNHGPVVGIEFRMDPDWKVYWRSPGDAGFPPVPDWTGTTGANSLDIQWPMPERFTFYGLETYGYGKRVVLPVKVDRTDAALSVHLKLSYAACAEICVPVDTTLSMDVAAGPMYKSLHAQNIRNFVRRVPIRDIPLINVSAELVRKNELRVAIQSEIPLFQSSNLIVETPPAFLIGTPVCDVGQARTICISEILDQPETETLAGQTITLTFANGPRFAETDAMVTAATQ